jgi:hypothetical protein
MHSANGSSDHSNAHIENFAPMVSRSTKRAGLGRVERDRRADRLDTDLRNGDGAESEQSFPFICTVEVPIMPAGHVAGTIRAKDRLRMWLITKCGLTAWTGRPSPTSRLHRPATQPGCSQKPASVPSKLRTFD